MFIDPTTHEYRAFQEKADHYATSSVNGVAGGQYRMNAAESRLSILETKLAKAEAETVLFKDIAVKMTEHVGLATEAIKRLADMVNALGEQVMVLTGENVPVVKLDDDEFFAAAANPKAYNLRG